MTSKQSLFCALIQTGLARKTDFILSSKYTLLGWNGSTDVLLPPKNRTCEFPRIRLDVALALSFALGKRFAVAKLTASLAYRLEPSFDRDCSSLLAALFRHPLSKSAPASLSSLPCGRAGLEASYLSPISPRVSLRFLDRLLPNAVPSPFLVPIPLGLPCSQVDPMAARKGDLVLYSGDLLPTEAR